MNAGPLLTLSCALGLAIQPLAAAAPDTRIPDGRRVQVRLLEAVSSETSTPGQPVKLETAEDVTLDGVVVIRRGTPVRGFIAAVEAHTRAGRFGKLTVAITETQSVDRQTLRLRATPAKPGGGAPGGVSVTTPLAAGPAGAVGSLEGTLFDAFVDGDQVARTAGSAAAAGAPSSSGNPGNAPMVMSEVIILRLLRGESLDAREGQAPGSETVLTLTNKDIITLVGAGIGEDVIISKIRSSNTDFKLDAADLVALKEAGVSDRLLNVMLQPQAGPAPTGTPAPEPADLSSRYPARLELPRQLRKGPDQRNEGRIFVSGTEKVATLKVVIQNPDIATFADGTHVAMLQTSGGPINMARFKLLGSGKKGTYYILATVVKLEE